MKLGITIDDAALERRTFLKALLSLLALPEVSDGGGDEDREPHLLMAAAPYKSNDPTPATRAYVVAASSLSSDFDPTTIATPPGPFKIRGVSFGTAGALKIDTATDSGVVIPSGALAAGIMHPIEITKIYSSGTGAQGIVVYG